MSPVQPPGPVLLDCGVCRHSAGPFAPPEAAQLATAHDSLHHRRRPTVTVRTIHVPAA